MPAADYRRSTATAASPRASSRSAPRTRSRNCPRARAGARAATRFRRSSSAASHPGASREGGARQQGRGAHDLPVARRRHRADAEHRARRHLRKITNPQDRKRLKAAAADLEVPEALGLIIRTAGAARTARRSSATSISCACGKACATSPCRARRRASSEEGNLTSIRDLYNKDVEEIVVAGADAAGRPRPSCACSCRAMPRT